jgi:PKHD-type hydroxylase
VEAGKDAMLLVIEGFLSRDETARLAELYRTGNFHDGRGTAGVNLQSVKQNEQFKMSEQQARLVREMLSKAMERNEKFQSFAMPKRIHPPLLSRYGEGMEYGSHIDAPIMGGRDPLRSDLSMTLFLSDPGSYDGGELELDTPFGQQRVKLMTGDAVVYSTTLRHSVRPVTRGRRIALVTWIQSHVKSLEKRQILYDLSLARKGLMAQLSRNQETELLLKAQTNLFKMWAEV